MSRCHWRLVFFLLGLFPALFQPATAERVSIVVARDGSGDYRTIQAALDAIPADSRKTVVILIKNGTYAEKLFITVSHVALVGEHRDSTRIVYPELRRNWVREHGGDDWGAAVVNIGENASDLILANLTVYNNYGALHGDHDHQFALRSGGGATRITLLHCRILADGGDTVSLWNKVSGMYYHADCAFEGWVDYVCPRGWCYITDCSFFGHNLTASIWHDGSAERVQKFVIRNSTFDGVQDFPLGRNHRDGLFILLDCRFSSRMADRPIYPARPDSAYRWGQRYYYSGCHRDGGDFPWFSDNLQLLDGAPPADEIDARWAFHGEWDPESTLPAVLPFAAIPSPRLDARGIQVTGTTLRWIPGRDAESHDVFLGTTNPPPLVAHVGSAEYSPRLLERKVRYYWRIDEVTDHGRVTGKLWEFTTR
jgi:pectinesterase